MLPETRKRPREAPGFIQSPRGGKGGAAPIFRYFLAFFSDFYFVICLSSPSILVVYDTDNKLSLLSLSLSPDLSCFQLAIPLPSAARLGAPRLRTVLPTHADGAGSSREDGQDTHRLHHTIPLSTGAASRERKGVRAPSAPACPWWGRVGTARQGMRGC